MVKEAALPKMGMKNDVCYDDGGGGSDDDDVDDQLEVMLRV